MHTLNVRSLWHGITPKFPLTVNFRLLTFIFSSFRKFAKRGLLDSSCLCTCPSAWNNSAPTGQIFIKFDFGTFRKSVQKVHVSLKSDKNNGYCTQRPMHVCDSISLNSSWNQTCLSQNLWRESKQAFYVQKRFSQNRAFYEITCKNTVQPERPGMTIYYGALHAG
jgi:hypothetical protein